MQAKVRMESWIRHNDHHKEEYELLADNLEAAGKSESATFVREMTGLMEQGNESLRKALNAL